MIFLGINSRDLFEPLGSIDIIFGILVYAVITTIIVVQAIKEKRKKKKERENKK